MAGGCGGALLGRAPLVRGPTLGLLLLLLAGGGLRERRARNHLRLTVEQHLELLLVDDARARAHRRTAAAAAAAEARPEGAALAVLAEDVAVVDARRNQRLAGQPLLLLKLVGGRVDRLRLLLGAGSQVRRAQQVRVRQADFGRGRGRRRRRRRGDCWRWLLVKVVAGRAQLRLEVAEGRLLLLVLLVKVRELVR